MRRLAQFSILLSAVVFFFTAQAAFSLLDEARPYGTSGSITISRVGSASKSDALSDISEIARKYKVNIFKSQPKLEDSISSRVLYVFKGNEDSYQEFYASGYPNFSPNNGTVEIRDAAQITTEDIRGTYVISGENASVDQIVADLNSADLVAQPENSSLLTIWLLAVGRTHLAGVICSVLLTVLIVIAYFISQQKKIYAIRKIHGYSKQSNLFFSLGQVLRDFALASLTVFVAGSCYLCVRNHFAQFGRFWLACAVTFVILAIFILIVTISSVTLFGSINVAKAIKGEKDALKVGAIAIVVEVAILVVVTVTINSSISRVSAINEALHASEAWRTGEPLYTLRLSVTGTREDDERAAPLFSQTVRELEAQGKVLLTFQDKYADPQDPYAYGAANSIIVNNNYLKRQVVLDNEGRRIEQLPEERDRFFMLVPDTYEGNKDLLAKNYVERLLSTCRLGIEDSSDSCSPKATVITIKSGQVLPSYGQTAELPVEYQEKALIQDPILTVISSKSELIAPLDYLSYSSTGALLFEDPETLRMLLTEKGILDNFQGIDNAADAVAHSIQISQGELRMDAFSIILSFSTFVITTFILAMAHCDRSKKIIFVRKIHGFRFYARHRAYIHVCVTVCLLSATVALGLYHPKPFTDTATSAILAAGALCITMGALKVYEKRMQADYIKRD